MRRTTPAWKVLLSVLCLVLAAAIWKKGLEDSFSRPSVVPELALQQKEIALLAEPSVHPSVRPLLIGPDPEILLRDALDQISLEELDDRQRVLRAALEPSIDKRLEVLSKPLMAPSLVPIQKALLESPRPEGALYGFSEDLAPLNRDPLLNQLSCLALGGDVKSCVDTSISRAMALRLAISQGLPAIGLLLGSGLLIRQVWLLFRKVAAPWPEVLAMPLSLADMGLLVAGGFVVLGEVVSPVFSLPLSGLLTKGLASPLSDSLKVVIGYSVMTLPPLLILRSQMRSLDSTQRPVDGWLQWRVQPFSKAIFSAVRGWLMVLPAVLFTGWLMTRLVGDQGGSNPLLGLVLNSRDPLALALLIATTVFLAPLFEEVVFRGVLLPVLAKSFGPLLGVVFSAVIFGIAHLSVGELPPLVVLGLGLGILRLSSGRLLPCVLMHALWNGVTFLNLVLLGG